MYYLRYLDLLAHTLAAIILVVIGVSVLRMSGSLHSDADTQCRVIQLPRGY